MFYYVLLYILMVVIVFHPYRTFGCSMLENRLNTLPNWTEGWTKLKK